ncbi:MAG: sulfotransferase [Cyanobacteria bacterium P01_D01_bin.1]
MNRLFLVGCARSGTTLLQSLLASHPEVASFPESNFFNHLFPHSEPKRKRLGIISRRAKPTLVAFLKESGYEGDRLSPLALFPWQLTAYFSKTLDQITAQKTKTTWIEKTPSHLYHLDYITQHIDRPKFIHIIRTGKDTVASLYDVRRKYPRRWANEPPSIEMAVERWIKDVSISLRCADLPNHFLLRYEDLVANPQATLTALCEFMELDFFPAMLSGYAATASQVSLAREPWKAGVSLPIRNANATKFYSLFSSQQQEYISQRVSAVDRAVGLAM